MSTGFKILLVLHIIAVVAAFGPLFVLGQLHRSDPGGARRLFERLCLPALVAVWVLGMALVGSSGDGEEKVSFSDGWVSASFVLWLATLGVGLFMVRPALAARGDTGRPKLSAGLGIIHLLLAVIVALMVFQPGS